MPAIGPMFQNKLSLVAALITKDTTVKRNLERQVGITKPFQNCDRWPSPESRSNPVASHLLPAQAAGWLIKLYLFSARVRSHMEAMCLSIRRFCLSPILESCPEFHCFIVRLVCALNKE